MFDQKKCIFPLKWIDLNNQIYKDPTVWLDEAATANNSIPPSFPPNMPTQPHQKYLCKHEKITVFYRV